MTKVQRLPCCSLFQAAQRRQTSRWLESEGPLGSDISGDANTFLCSRRLATRRWRLSRNVRFQRHLEWKVLFHFAVMSGNTRLASMSLAMCGSSCTCFKLSRFLEKVAQRACFQPHCSKYGYALWRCSFPQLFSQLE